MEERAAFKELLKLKPKSSPVCSENGLSQACILFAQPVKEAERWPLGQTDGLSLNSFCTGRHGNLQEPN